MIGYSFLFKKGTYYSWLDIGWVMSGGWWMGDRWMFVYIVGVVEGDFL
jgi:hypothetical protein